MYNYAFYFGLNKNKLFWCAIFNTFQYILLNFAFTQYYLEELNGYEKRNTDTKRPTLPALFVKIVRFSCVRFFRKRGINSYNCDFISVLFKINDYDVEALIHKIIYYVHSTAVYVYFRPWWSVLQILKFTIIFIIKMKTRP